MDHEDDGLAPGKTGAAPARRRGGMRALAATLPAVTRRALKRRGFAEGGLIVEWASIVGAAIAARCLPKKLSLARPGGRQEGTLVVRVEPAFAVELQHLEPLLVERINGHFGYRAIARLILHQGPLTLGSSPRAAPRPLRPLSAAEEAALHRRVAAVEDDEVRGALERLGRAMRQRAGT
jgi:hypothetical protein